MVIEFRDFQIRPYSNHLCWEVWERKPYKLPRNKAAKATAKEGEMVWAFTGKYPSDLESALRTVQELALKRYGDCLELSLAVKEVKAVTAELAKAASR